MRFLKQALLSFKEDNFALKAVQKRLGKAPSLTRKFYCLTSGVSGALNLPTSRTLIKAFIEVVFLFYYIILYDILLYDILYSSYTHSILFNAFYLFLLFLLHYNNTHFYYFHLLVVRLFRLIKFYKLLQKICNKSG